MKDTYKKGGEKDQGQKNVGKKQGEKQRCENEKSKEKSEKCKVKKVLQSQLQTQKYKTTENKKRDGKGARKNNHESEGQALDVRVRVWSIFTVQTQSELLQAGISTGSGILRDSQRLCRSTKKKNSG